MSCDWAQLGGCSAGVAWGLSRVCRQMGLESFGDWPGHGESCRPLSSRHSQCQSVWSFLVVSPAEWLRAPKNVKVEAARPVKTQVQNWRSIPFAVFCCLKQVTGTAQTHCWSKRNKGVSARSVVHWVPVLEASYLHCWGLRKLQVLLIPFFPSRLCFNNFILTTTTAVAIICWVFCECDTCMTLSRRYYFTFTTDLHSVIKPIWQMKKLRLRAAKYFPVRNGRVGTWT